MADSGLTDMDEPVPMEVPPHDPEYHFHEAPVPNEPPLTESVVLPPGQILVVPEIPVGATD